MRPGSALDTQAFEYDNNGRVTRIVRDGLDQRLTWDALDRIVRIEDLNFVEEPVEFTYDGQGRRVSADRANSAQRYVVGPTGNQSLESPHLVHNGAFLTGELVYGGEHALWRYQGDGTTTRPPLTCKPTTRPPLTCKQLPLSELLHAPRPVSMSARSY